MMPKDTIQLYIDKVRLLIAVIGGPTKDHVVGLSK